jgi:cation diffusion facilitator family transporter
MNTNQIKYLVALLSVFSNAGLVLIKLVVGFSMGSIAVISEAAHSAIDVIAAIVAVVGVRQSGVPADLDHPFGHGKFENLSGFIQALLIFTAAAWIIYQSIEKLLHPHPLQTLGLGVMVMLVSSVVNLIVGYLLLRVGKKYESVALKADAWHCLTDVYTSAGVMAALCVVWLVRRWLPSAEAAWVDPLAAMGVALLIVKAAWDLTLESLGDLLDVRLPKKEEEAVVALLQTHFPLIKGFHNLRTRRSGHVRFFEFHIFVDGHMTVSDSHKLDHDVAKHVKEHFPNAQVMVHIEPDARHDR